MKNTRENAEKFICDFGKGRSFVDRLEGIPDFVDLLTEYGNKVQNRYIPNDAHSFEVFAIKDSVDSPTGKQAFIGFKLDNGNFDFIIVSYTEPIKKEKNWFSKFFKSFMEKLNQEHECSIVYNDWCMYHAKRKTLKSRLKLLKISMNFSYEVYIKQVESVTKNNWNAKKRLKKFRKQIMLNSAIS